VDALKRHQGGEALGQMAARTGGVWEAIYDQGRDPEVMSRCEGACYALFVEWARRYLSDMNTLPEQNPRHPIWGFFEQLHRGETAAYVEHQIYRSQVIVQQEDYIARVKALGSCADADPRKEHYLQRIKELDTRRVTGLIWEYVPGGHFPEGLRGPKDIEALLSAARHSVDRPCFTGTLGLFLLIIGGGNGEPSHALGLRAYRAGGKDFWALFDANAGEITDIPASQMTSFLQQQFFYPHYFRQIADGPIKLHRISGSRPIERPPLDPEPPQTRGQKP
jgi:hypothetical protein